MHTNSIRERVAEADTISWDNAEGLDAAEDETAVP
jgi:hypothetical protein